VLSLLLENDHALSHADLEREMKLNCDRVTLYRTLKTFQEKGLVHKVLDDHGITKYAPCTDCSLESHTHEHVHFKCDICGNTVCIEDVKIPQVTLPNGYLPKEQNLLITGVCNICKKK
jgi:Fur family ferric uptake transcriptional regulator